MKKAIVFCRRVLPKIALSRIVFSKVVPSAVVLSIFVLCGVIFAPASFGQATIPVGTILPVQLNTSLRSDKAKPGQVITARLMQDVPLPGSSIRAGAKIIGHVISVQPHEGSGAKIVFRFDTLVAGNRRIPITTNLRALASMMEVNDAQVPAFGPDRGTSEFDWNTTQIGDEVNYHGTIVAKGLHAVGTSVPPDGALVDVSSASGTPCRGAFDGNEQPQATWVFSSDACGVYGFGGVTLVHAGRTNPIGEIVLRSDKGNLNIRAGSGMLLRVD